MLVEYQRELCQRAAEALQSEALLEVLCHAALAAGLGSGVVVAQVRGRDGKQGIEQGGVSDGQGQDGVGAGASKEVQLQLGKASLEVVQEDLTRGAVGGGLLRRAEPGDGGRCTELSGQGPVNWPLGDSGAVAAPDAVALTA
jgi:hypothetical protein